MSHQGESALDEWRSNWTLPFAAMIGFSAAAIHAYALGAFIVPLEREFGWTRSQITLGITVTALISAAFSVAVGLLVDRFGSRPLGLIGVAGITASIALLGTATGTLANWMLLWAIIGVAGLFMQATVWTKPIASSFARSRGLALAVTLSGGGIAATIVPVLAGWLVADFGWRYAYFALGGVWALLALPVVVLYFHNGPSPDAPGPGAEDRSRPPFAELPGLSVPEALRSPAFYKLLVTSLLFVLTLFGVIIHFVPILTEHGASPMRAAATASLIGISSIVGRIGTGFLIDRLPAHRVGAGLFLLPIVASLVLVLDGTSPWVQALAAICFGLALGGEVDVLAYLTTRYLGLRNFGVLFGALIGALSLGGAVGPLAAGYVRDVWGNYNPFLVAGIACFTISCLAIASLGRPKFDSAH